MHICQRNSHQPMQDITMTSKSDLATKVKFNSNIPILLHSTAHLYFIMCGGVDPPLTQMFAVPQSTTSESLKIDRATRYILLKVFEPFPSSECVILSGQAPTTER